MTPEIREIIGLGQSGHASETVEGDSKHTLVVTETNEYIGIITQIEGPNITFVLENGAVIGSCSEATRFFGAMNS